MEEPAAAGPLVEVEEHHAGAPWRSLGEDVDPPDQFGCRSVVVWEAAQVSHWKKRDFTAAFRGSQDATVYVLLKIKCAFITQHPDFLRPELLLKLHSVIYKEMNSFHGDLGYTL